MVPGKVFILDNGASSIKAGFSSQEEPTLLYNATAKVDRSMEYLVGNQIDSYRNGSLLKFCRPFDRGYLTNWGCEIDIWHHLFGEYSSCNPSETSLVLTEPPLNPESIQNDTNEIVFEYFGFSEYFRRPAFAFSAYGSINNPTWNPSGLPCCTVVDSGFSFTHIAPFINGKCQKHAV